jgi:hypothetical protein
LYANRAARLHLNGPPLNTVCVLNGIRDQYPTKIQERLYAA